MANSKPFAKAPGAGANDINNCPLLDLSSAFSLDRELMSMDRPRAATCPPLPLPPASLSSEAFPPASLSLPVLAPRATKHSRRFQRRDNNVESPSLMSFVSNMSLNDVASSINSSSYASSTNHSILPPTRSTLLPRNDSAPDLEDEEERPAATASSEKSVSEIAAFAMEVAGGVVKRLQATPSSYSQFSLATPEPTKTVLSTPQAIRPSICQKRKSPLVQCTPVNGSNHPLMGLPSLNEKIAATPQSPHHPQEPCVKKAKNYRSLMNNAPMLPASPDLETRGMAVPRFHPPCFSPPVGGVTLVNPNFRVLATPVETPVPPARRALTVTAAAGLPSLDEVERSAPKWLRMKRRESLLYALRIATTANDS